MTQAKKYTFVHKTLEHVEINVIAECDQSAFNKMREIAGVTNSNNYKFKN